MVDEPRKDGTGADGPDESSPDWSPKAPPDLNIILRGGEMPGQDDAEGESGEAPSMPSVQPPQAPRRLNPRYELGEDTVTESESHPAYAPEFEQPSGMNTRWVIIGLVVILLVVVGFFTVPRLLDKNGAAKTTTSKKTDKSKGGEETELAGFEPYTIDDAFYAKLRDALAAANTELEQKAPGNYIYRYSLQERTERAVSQVLNISLFLGGKEADKLAQSEDGTVAAALKGYTDSLAAREGVSVVLLRHSTKGDEPAGEKDFYLRYGYYWGREHMAQIKDVTDALEGYKQGEAKHYPGSLLSAMPSAKSRGNMSFEAGGYGYLPIYATDGSGNIRMGTGGGVSSYYPEAVTDYYLFVFLREPTEGIDAFSPEDVQYFIDNISPFPYKPDGPVHNVTLHPDGKPDGVACVVKNGELLKD